MIVQVGILKITNVFIIEIMFKILYYYWEDIIFGTLCIKLCQYSVSALPPELLDFKKIQNFYLLYY